MPDQPNQNRPRRSFSDDEASRIWRRAAELQARRRLPTQAEGAAGGSASSSAEQHHLSSEEIVTIAREAGIDDEFVQQALTEAEFAPDGPEEDPSVFLTRRRIDTPPATLEAAVQEVAAREPFKLRLIDMQPAGRDRVLIFQLSGEWGNTLQAGDMAAAPNITAVHALVQEGERPDTSELILYGVPNPNLPRSVRRHDVIFGGLGGIAGGVTGVAGGLELALGGMLLAAPLAAGALLLGGTGIGIMRSAQRWARRKDAASLEQLADEIVGAIRLRRHTRQLSSGEDPQLTA